MDSQPISSSANKLGLRKAVEKEESVALDTGEILQSQTSCREHARTRDQPSHLVRNWHNRIVIVDARGVGDAGVEVGERPSHSTCNGRTHRSCDGRTHRSGNDRAQI